MTNLIGNYKEPSNKREQLKLRLQVAAAAILGAVSLVAIFHDNSSPARPQMQAAETTSPTLEP